MKNQILGVMVCALLATNTALADTFAGGTANAFNIDFVPISGSTNPTSGYGIVNNDYRMGTYEITNNQWNKFKAAYGAVAGTPTTAYDQAPTFSGTSVPTNNVSWYEAAQFVNFLNTSTGHTAAYTFTGTIHTSSYTLGVWGSGDADGTNLYRNKNAFYFLPTENEWVKAAYWNGTNLQTYATKAGEILTQGNGTSGTGWNYFNPSNNKYATSPMGPWNVGSGSQELNGMYDMMGNVWEWTESPWKAGDYLSSSRSIRGGSYFADGFGLDIHDLMSSNRRAIGLSSEYDNVGFRVASIPEPASLVLLSLGGLALRRKSCR